MLDLGPETAFMFLYLFFFPVFVESYFPLEKYSTANKCNQTYTLRQYVYKHIYKHEYILSTQRLTKTHFNSKSCTHILSISKIKSKISQCLESDKFSVFFKGILLGKDVHSSYRRMGVRERQVLSLFYKFNFRLKKTFTKVLVKLVKQWHVLFNKILFLFI